MRTVGRGMVLGAVALAALGPFLSAQEKLIMVISYGLALAPVGLKGFPWFRRRRRSA